MLLDQEKLFLTGIITYNYDININQSMVVEIRLGKCCFNYGDLGVPLAYRLR